MAIYVDEWKAYQGRHKLSPYDPYQTNLKYFTISIYSFSSLFSKLLIHPPCQLSLVINKYEMYSSSLLEFDAAISDLQATK